MEMKFRDGYLDGVYANITTTVLFFILFVIGYFIFALLSVRKRKKLMNCFGVSNSNPTFKIFVSRIEVKGGPDTGPIEDLLEGYIGLCINKPEYDSALAFRSLMLVEWLPRFPKRLHEWFTTKNYTFVDLQPQVEISPHQGSPDKDFDAIESSNLLLIGGNVYNSLSKRFFDSNNSILCLKKTAKQPNEQSVINKELNQTYFSRSEGRELAIVQRIKINDATVTVCAGTGTGATCEAVNYIIKNWEQHFDKSSKGDFALVLAWNSVINVNEPFKRDPDAIFPWYKT